MFIHVLTSETIEYLTTNGLIRPTLLGTKNATTRYYNELDSNYKEVKNSYYVGNSNWYLGEPIRPYMRELSRELTKLARVRDELKKVTQVKQVA